MDKYTTYVGMDVHARSITAQGVVLETGEHLSKRFGAGYSAADVANWFASLPQPVYCAYESGCTGVWLARDLRALGYACDVIAISTIARSTKDRQQKCDKLDAKAILAAIANPLSKHSVIWIPTKQQEGERDLARLYAKVSAAAKRAKQELVAFLMRHGRIWNEKTKTGNIKKPTGDAYERWLNSITFDDEVTEAVYGEVRRRVSEAETDKKRIEKLMRARARHEENAAYVSALASLKGVSEMTAYIIKTEIGDFERFTGGRKVSCWLGCIPKNSSSGERTVHGSITKAGNKYLRRALIEGVSGISRWSGAPKKPLCAPPSAPLAALAAKANARLYERARHLKCDLAKNPNVIKVAIANELVRWAWVVGREVQRGQTRSNSMHK